MKSKQLQVNSIKHANSLFLWASVQIQIFVKTVLNILVKPKHKYYSVPIFRKRPTFQYPSSRQYPFDEVCELIVRALESRNWQVPDIKVEFETIGSGECKWQFVKKVTGANFRLYFWRDQRFDQTNEVCNLAAVMEIAMPYQQLNVQRDESRIQFYYYVGDDWKSDRDEFIRGNKYESSFRELKRTYLLYRGVKVKGSKKVDSDTRRLILKHKTDGVSEYELEFREPEIFPTDVVMEEFRIFLTDHVLSYILAYPVAEKLLDMLAPEPDISVPDWASDLYTFASYYEVCVVGMNLRDPRLVPPSRRFAFGYYGPSLVPYQFDVGESILEVTQRSFLRCGIGDVSKGAQNDDLEIPGLRWYNQKKFLFKINLNRANNVYVADYAVYIKRKQEIFSKITDGRHLLSFEEMVDIDLVFAKTIVPLVDYDGGFQQPVVLVQREVEFDEVKFIQELRYIPFS
ncbi:MAG: hypothetical protein RLZZ230_759 [Candidatus Parcubacteria bacterium]|jgi:hypothetical protein